MNRSPLSHRAHRIQEVFHELADLEPLERSHRLNELDDPVLRDEIVSLLASHDGVAELQGFLGRLRPSIDPPENLVAQDVAHYRIEEKMGGGGMATVYRARDARLGRAVALKVLSPHLSSDDSAKKRFIQEARAASACDHPNIAVVHDIGETDDGRLFIAMALYEGETLAEKIARGALRPSDAVDYARQLASGLGRAHRQGIIHRDVKPANVIVTEDNMVKLVDFGIAKMADVHLTKTRMTLGTVRYMSPEQIRGRRVDPRSDLWSLGVVLFEMLTGQPPFQGRHEQAIMDEIVHGELVPLPSLRADVPEWLVRIVGRLLEKDPNDRYATAENVVVDLDQLIFGRRQYPTATSSPRGSAPPSRSTPSGR